MKETDILHHCRYYHGEKNNPFDCKSQNNAMFWDYERKWVQDMKNDADFSDVLAEYMNVGLRDFSETDDTPITLKALLFNRFCHWRSASMLDCVEDFKKFYDEKYLHKNRV